jgi:hypothetical protein
MNSTASDDKLGTPLPGASTQTHTPSSPAGGNGESELIAEDSNTDSGNVVFVFDRVMHYHKATLREINCRLGRRRIRFSILSAKDKAGSVGRVAESAKVVPRHDHFKLSERSLGGFMLRNQHGLVGMLDALKPAVVVSMCHSGTISEWAMLHWAKRNGVRRVAWQCGYEFNPGVIKRLALGWFVPQFDFHLCYHTNARIYALQHGARDDQTLVMHNTIDERAISPVDPVLAKAALIEKYPTLRDKKLVLYVGAVLEEKRLELVFDALGQLGRSDTVFVVVGDGPHLPVLKTRYANRTDWVATGSIVDGVGLYFDAADVFVLPGTGGLAINEAMAHRLPVISGYADGSADDLVVNRVTGYRLRQQTAAELADRLDALLSDLPRARDMGRRGEQRIRGHLSFESFIDRVVGVLETQHALSSRKS